jgi:hypothetical protein
LLGGGSRGEVAEHWEAHLLVLGCLYKQIDPTDEHNEFEQTKKCALEAPAVPGKEQRWYSSVDDEPSQEQVERLKGIEADARVGSKSMRCQKHDCWDNAENWHIAQNRGGAIAYAVEKICVLRAGVRLRGAAVMAKGRPQIDASSTVRAKRQNSNLLKRDSKAATAASS